MAPDRRRASTIALLLAGVTMTAFFQALILFTQYLADFADTFRTVRWLMGTLDVGSYAPILAALPIVLIAFAMLATLPRSLDLISLGTDAAAARGVNVLAAERLALASASLATGAAVSLAARSTIGARRTAPVRLVVGSITGSCCRRRRLRRGVPDGCDAVARTVWSSGELPVGIVTALIGGPFFLWLLVRK